MQTWSFIFTHIFSISNTPQYFLWILVNTWYHFLLAQSSSFIISDREDLPAVDSLSFCLSGNVLFQLHFWRIVLLDINFLVQFFSLSVLWISFHCFLASTIAYEPLPYYYYYYYFFTRWFALLLSRFFLSAVWLWYIWMWFSLCVLTWYSWNCRLMFTSNLRHFQPLCIQILPLPLLSLLSSETPSVSIVRHMTWRAAPKSAQLTINKWFRWWLY